MLFSSLLYSAITTCTFRLQFQPMHPQLMHRKIPWVFHVVHLSFNLNPLMTNVCALHSPLFNDRTMYPTLYPTVSPTLYPTLYPTLEPTLEPSSYPWVTYKSCIMYFLSCSLCVLSYLKSLPTYQLFCLLVLLYLLCSTQNWCSVSQPFIARQL